MNVCISTTHLAEELGVRPETVAHWIRQDRIKGAFLRRGRWSIPLEEAEAFAEEYRARQKDEAEDTWEEEDDWGNDDDQEWDDWEDEEE